MSDSKSIVREWVESVQNQGDLSRLDQLATPDYAQSYRENHARNRATFSDFHLDIHEIIAEDDKVMVVWEAAATHQGNWRGVPATLKPVTWRGITLYYLEGGKIAEEITSWNQLDMYEQLVGLPDWFINV